MDFFHAAALAAAAFEALFAIGFMVHGEKVAAIVTSVMCSFFVFIGLWGGIQ